MVKKKVNKKKKVVKKKAKSFDDNKFLLGAGIFIGLLLLLGFVSLIVDVSTTGYAASDSVIKDANAGIEIAKGTLFGVKDQVLTPLFEFLLGEQSGGEHFFSMVLFFILIFGVGFSALSKVDFFQEHRLFLYLFVSIVTIFATRTIGTADFMSAILLPYTAIGITISAAAPLIFWFMVVNKGFSNYPAIVRKVAWILFGVVFLGLYIYRREELISLSYIYVFTAVISLGMVLFDGTIRKYAVVKAQTDKAKIAMNKTIIDDLTAKIGDYGVKLQNNSIEIGAYNKAINEIQKKINALS